MQVQASFAKRAPPAPAHAGAVGLEPNLRRLRAYQAVYQAGSVQAASQQLHLAQSSLTRAVQALEAALGVALFERTHKGMVPTGFGALLAGRVQRAMDHLRLAEEEVDRGCAAASRFGGRITHRQLSVLIGIADHHTESDAARQLALSQPAVTMALRELERRVGAALFHRTSHGMIPTWAGEILLRRSKLAFAEVAAAAADIAAQAGALAGRVAVGVLPLSGSLLAPRAIERLLEAHPCIEVSVVDGTYRALLQGLLCGDIDLIVGGLKYPVPPEIRQEELFMDELACVVRAGHPLAQRAAVGRADLMGREWVLPRTGTPARQRVDELLAALDLDPGRHPIECNSLPIVRSLILESERIAIISPHQVYFERQAGQVRILPTRLPGQTIPIGLRTRAAASLPAGVRALMDHLRQVAADLNPG